MNLTPEQKQMISLLKSVYDNIQFHGVYAKYTRSVGVLARILKLEDPAELHYVMMHLSRLSYLKNRDGSSVWVSRRYAELLGKDAFLGDEEEGHVSFNEVLAKDELAKMETEAFRFHQITTNLIDTHLKGKGHFTCHAKVYPIYDENGEVVLSLGILAEVASRESVSFVPSREEMDESVLAI